MTWRANTHPLEQIQRARQRARAKWYTATPYRMGLVAREVRLNFNPYPEGTRSHVLFQAGSGIATTTWPCGHPKTPDNTRAVGAAGYRCRECRMVICRRHRERKLDMRG